MHFLTLPLLFGVSHALLVPSPPGPYSVAVHHFELVDSGRIDPFAPEANTTRRFMASAYLPIDAAYDCKAQVVPYMPPVTAGVYSQVGEELGIPQGIIEEFEMEFCNISTVDLGENHSNETQQFPVTVFSPGFGGTRFVYGALARSMASLGYIVITVDPTFEAAVVEFPDGFVAYAQPSAASDPALTVLELEVRAADVSFLISQLSNPMVTDSVFANFPGTFDSLKVAAYGHSFGGSTSAQAALLDSRVVGGVTIDGPVYGSVGDEGIKRKPFVLVTNGGTPVFDPEEYTEFYDKIKGPRMQLVVRDTEHYAFTDVPLLLTEYEIPPESNATAVQVFGTLPGRQMEAAVNQIVSGAVELIFNYDTKPLEDLGTNPDIEVVKSNLRGCQ